MGRAMGMHDTNGTHGITGQYFAERERPIDWAASCRLALVVSILAAAAALLLSTVVGETALVVCVIVAASAISWFHLENGQLTRAIPARHD